MISCKESNVEIKGRVDQILSEFGTLQMCIADQLSECMGKEQAISLLEECFLVTKDSLLYGDEQAFEQAFKRAGLFGSNDDEVTEF